MIKLEKLDGKQKQLYVPKLFSGLDQTISTIADEFWFLCNRSVRMLLGNQLLCDSIYLSSVDPHSCSLLWITHCLRPIQRKDTISISQMLIRVMDHPTPSWAFRMYPTCILFRVKSWPCVTFHAFFLSSKQYYRLYAWSTWNHYQTWVVMALLWKSFWFCIYTAIFTIVYWSWYNSYEHHAHSVLKKKVLLGPGHFPKLKIPLYQKAPAISYKPLSQLHTDDLVSFELLYKAAIPFEQTNKQTKQMGRKAGFLQSCRRYPRNEHERLKQIKHAFWLCIVNVTRQ